MSLLVCFCVHLEGVKFGVTVVTSKETSQPGPRRSVRNFDPVLTPDASGFWKVIILSAKGPTRFSSPKQRHSGVKLARTVDRSFDKKSNPLYNLTCQLRQAVLARAGKYWIVGYIGVTFSLKDVKGLSYIQLCLLKRRLHAIVEPWSSWRVFISWSAH